MRYVRAPLVCVAIVSLASPAIALDIMSESEIAERERMRKLQARPVLRCEPARLATRVKRGETAELRLNVGNGGGQVLRWSLSGAPAWLAADAVAGELKCQQSREVVLHVRGALIRSQVASARIQIAAPGAQGSPATVLIEVDIEPEPELEPEPEPDPEPVRTTPQPEPEPTPVRDASRPAAPRRGGMGVRVGYLLPAPGAVGDFSSNAFLGVQYSLGKKESRVSLELGVELASSEAQAVDSTSTLTTGRADILLHMGGSGLYLLSGLGSLIEDSEVAGSRTAGLLDLGAGMAIGEKLDVRLTHAVLLNGDNVNGLTQVSTAYRF